MTGALPRTIRGIRDSIPSGYVMGRVSAGSGPAELIDVRTLGQRINATGVSGGAGSKVSVAGNGIAEENGTITVEWNGGTVDAIGPGLTIVSVGTSSTLQAAIQAIGSGLTLSSGTLEATAVSSEWNAGTVSAIGSGLTLTSGTLTASGGTGGGTGLYNISAGVPTLTAFTQINMTTLDVITGYGTTAVSIVDANSAAVQLRGLAKAVPGSTPYRVAFLVQVAISSANYSGVEWGFSNGTEYETCNLFSSSGITYEKWATAASRSSSTAIYSSWVAGIDALWLGIRNDGTNVYWEMSCDGVNFLTVKTLAMSAGYLGTGGYTTAFIGYFNDSGEPLLFTLRVWDTAGLSRGY